jgi:hypothetical protein
MPDDNRKIVIRFFFIARVVPSEGEESLANHEEDLPSEDFRTRVPWDLIRFDINRKNDTLSTERQQNRHKEITT